MFKDQQQYSPFTSHSGTLCFLLLFQVSWSECFSFYLTLQKLSSIFSYFLLYITLITTHFWNFHFLLPLVLNSLYLKLILLLSFLRKFQIFLCVSVHSMKYTDFDALFFFELKYVKIAIETSLNHELFTGCFWISVLFGVLKLYAEFLHYKEKCGKTGKELKDINFNHWHKWGGVLLKLGKHVKKVENTSDFMWNICSPKGKL